MAPYIDKACLEQYGHIVVERLLSVTDDTKLLNKKIVSVLKAHLDEFLASEFGIFPIIALFAPKSTLYFSAIAVELVSAPSEHS